MSNYTTEGILVTSCPNHGTTEAPDLASARVYVNAALSCLHLSILTPNAHAMSHLIDCDSCWVCCDEMTIDPDNAL